jgi:hypothetical protein
MAANPTVDVYVGTREEIDQHLTGRNHFTICDLNSPVYRVQCEV